MNQPARVICQPVTAEYSVNCPACSAALFLVSPDSSRTPSGEPWLLDGDAIPGTTPDVEKGYSAMLSVGQCGSCREHYYVSQLTILHGDWDLLVDFHGGFDAFDAELPITNWLCAIPSQDQQVQGGWLLTRSDTPAGPVHEHTIGPFVLDRLSSVSGPVGVSACQGRGDTDPWSHARNVANALCESVFALLAEDVRVPMA